MWGESVIEGEINPTLRPYPSFRKTIFQEMWDDLESENISNNKIKGEKISEDMVK